MTGKELYDWRRNRGWSRDHAAAVIGVSASTLRNYEDGTRREDGRPVEIPKPIRWTVAAIDAGVADPDHSTSPP